MTLQVSKELEERLKFHSSQQGISEAELLEEILQKALPEPASRKKREWIGMVAIDPIDLSERVDELLYAQESKSQV